ncbi:RNA-binding protein CP31B, chloroplastic [Quillaja saponaria]|uniref:RNA-binding protein CP31B, chloroplastic n=1 Tax=Quillaja saponaria TaxID=32244 RepID=A0AAD7PW03_QUISA|nr:RNA-binding protein CP31B, chloroplastic [Quillaja saponaria]
MAATTICFTSPFSSLIYENKIQTAVAGKQPILCSAYTPSSIRLGHQKFLCLHALLLPQPNSSYLFGAASSLGSRNRARVSTVLAVVDEEAVIAGVKENDKWGEQNCYISGEQKQKKLARPCEIYVCNLPRSCDVSELLDMFKPYGNVVSVEICRNAESGKSRGSGYVTMGSINSAKIAIAALDGSDVGGREMRVRFSVEINPGRRNGDTMNSSPQKVIIYESPYKLYVGNLAWAIKPDELRNHFQRFGTVVSSRVLHDRKAGKNRVYGFLSFLSEAERDSAKTLDGKAFNGRTLVVRDGVERS